MKATLKCSVPSMTSAEWRINSFCLHVVVVVYFKFGDVKDGMDSLLRWNLEFVGDWVDALNDLKGPGKK